jgi:3-oxoacyl-[acyl-carrier-protein] synthase-3
MCSGLLSGSRTHGCRCSACEIAGIRPDKLAGFVPHQANLRIIEPLADQLGISREITARDVVTSGNTSSASIPIALARLVRRGQLPPDSPVLLFGSAADSPTPGR